MEAIVSARPEERENSDRRRRQERTLTTSDSIMDRIGILFIAAYTHIQVGCPFKMFGVYL